VVVTTLPSGAMLIAYHRFNVKADAERRQAVMAEHFEEVAR